MILGLPDTLDPILSGSQLVNSGRGRGLTFGNNRLYFKRQFPHEILVYTTSGTAIDSESFNLDSLNTGTRAIAILDDSHLFALDQADEKIYVYSIPSGDLLSDLTITLASITNADYQAVDMDVHNNKLYIRYRYRSKQRSNRLRGKCL